MPITVLEKEIETLPPESMSEIFSYIQYLKFKYNVDTKKQPRESNSFDVSKRFGTFPELQSVPNDIDFCNDEIAALFGV